LYDVRRTCLVRCSSYYQTDAKAIDMSDTESIETTSAAPQHENDVPLTTSSRRAAAIEAAYILEAVRK
jgi:predicted protein tyrosine phosphatase